MKACIEKVKEVGPCSYCDKGELKANGMGLDYPYDEVIVIGGKYVESKLCFECLGKLTDLHKTL